MTRCGEGSHESRDQHVGGERQHHTNKGQHEDEQEAQRVAIVDVSDDQGACVA